MTSRGINRRSAHSLRLDTRSFWILVSLMSVIQILSPDLLRGNSFVACQDFEDLNNSNRLEAANAAIQQQLPQQQPSSRHPQSVQSVGSSRQHSFTRPVLSSRFSAAGANNNNQTPINGQVVASASVLSPTTSLSAGPVSSGPAANIEQMMKNALSRGAQSTQVLESRQDLAPVASQEPQAPRSSQQAAPVAPIAVDKTAEASDAPTEVTASDEADKQTNADQTSTTSGHETVYSDQRFANLFARRNSLKKSKITPTEQVKAKPTLPSFIKSPPDPKQFTAAQASGQQERQSTPSGVAGNNFASSRLQQQQNQSGRLINSQKKPVLTSTSAANANNKRTNTLNAKQNVNSSNSNPKTAANQKGNNSTSKPATIGNNPFGRTQNNNSDPANVIAMARKRLLANNALESAKLKSQQQQPKPTTT